MSSPLRRIISDSDDSDDDLLTNDLFSSTNKLEAPTSTKQTTEASNLLEEILKKRQDQADILQKDLGEEGKYDYQSDSDSDKSEDSNNEDQEMSNNDDSDSDDQTDDIPQHLLTAMTQRPNVERRKIAGRELRRFTCVHNPVSSNESNYPASNFHNVRVDSSTFNQDIASFLTNDQKNNSSNGDDGELELCHWLWNLIVRSRVEDAGFSILASERFCELLQSKKLTKFKLIPSAIITSLRELGCIINEETLLPTLSLPSSDQQNKSKKKTVTGNKRKRGGSPSTKGSSDVIDVIDLAKAAAVSVENNVRLLLVVVTACFINYRCDTNCVVSVSNTNTNSWHSIIACLIGLSVDARLSGAAIEIEQCVEAMTGAMVRESMYTTTKKDAAIDIGNKISLYYLSIEGNALSKKDNIEKHEKRKLYRMVLKMLTNMYFVTTETMLLLRYVIASSMLSDVFGQTLLNSTTGRSDGSNDSGGSEGGDSFDVVAIARKIVRIWKEEDLDVEKQEKQHEKNTTSSSSSSSTSLSSSAVNDAWGTSEDDYDDWGWLHDLLLMLRMCESYKFASSLSANNATSTTSSSSSSSKNSSKNSSSKNAKNGYGRTLVDILLLIKAPNHQYDIDISSFQQLHQNFLGQLKEREGRRSQFVT